MIFATHVKIASLVLEHLNPQEIMYVSRTQFIKGSNHPDYDLYYRSFGHYFSDSKDIILTTLQDLMSKPRSRYDRGFTLGIVAHFMADYMCSYHSNPHYRSMNLAKHIFYEQQLHSKTKHIETFDDQLFVATSPEELINTISKFIDEHMQDPIIDMELDFQRALSLVYAMVKMVLREVVPAFVPIHTGDDTPLRVAIYTDTYYPQINGVSNTIFHYIEYLRREHIPYVLISPKYKQIMTEKVKDHDIIRIPSIPYVLYKDARISLVNKRSLSRLIDDFNPTIIHVMTEFFIGHAGLQYGKERNIPVITNYSTHFVDYLRYMGIGLFQKPLTSYVKWFHQQSTQTTCPSHSTFEHLQSIGIHNTTIFGRGIHTKDFSPSYRSHQWRQQFSDSPFIYLYVGRVSAEKEIDLALTAFASIKKRHPHTEFVVVGDGPKRATYEREFPMVHFLGYKTGKELSMIYASSDVFVFPSATETLGNVVLEALASCLPVITANAGGVLENVKHMQNGMIAQSQTPQAYAEWMELYLMNKAKLIETKTNAYEGIKEKTWQRIFQTQITKYQHIIKEARISAIKS